MRSHGGSLNGLGTPASCGEEFSDALGARSGRVPGAVRVLLSTLVLVVGEQHFDCNHLGVGT